MLPAIEILFWICFFIIFYTYIGYPLLLSALVKAKYLLGKSSTRSLLEKDLSFPVSLIITAYNEQDIIEEKIKNCFAIDYPPDMIEYIFITDGSTDNTPAIISRYPAIRLLHLPERKGKLAAMNRAVDHALNPYIIFSDANAFLNKESVAKMTRHYTLQSTGGVSGEKKILKNKGGGAVSSSEGLYWKYESMLKKLDSDLYSTVGAAGELFSIKKKLYKKIPENTIIEDFVQSLQLCTEGFRVAYEPGAFSEEAASLSVKDEMERKTRIAAGAFQAMGMLKKLFNIFKYPVVSFQFISHRVLRWTLCPLALLVFFIASLLLYFAGENPLYTLVFAAQLIFYLAALAGWYYASRGVVIKGLFFPFYFLMMNYCIFAGFKRFLSHTQSAIWEKAERKARY